MAAPAVAVVAAPAVAAPYDGKFAALRPLVARGPPSIGHIQRVAAGANGLRFLEYDEATLAPKVGAALVAFPGPMQALCFLTFDSPAELFAAVNGDMQCLIRARDLSHAQRHLRLVYQGGDYEFLKINLNGTCVMAHYFEQTPWRTPPDVTVSYKDLKGIQVYVPPPVVGAVPALAPSSTAPVRVEVVHTKDTHKIADGTQRWKKMIASGQDLDRASPLAVKGAHHSGVMNAPKPMDWTNPLVVLDPYWYPYAYSFCASAAHARSGLFQGLSTFFVIQLANENVGAKGGKTNYKQYREGIDIILHAFDVIGREVLAGGTSTDKAWDSCEGMIKTIKEQLGCMLRRMSFPPQSPAEEGSICPLWYYNGHKEKRARGEDSD